MVFNVCLWCVFGVFKISVVVIYVNVSVCLFYCVYFVFEGVLKNVWIDRFFDS